jgi:uncharacterized protein YndB with AHSA1/START domain
MDKPYRVEVTVDAPRDEVWRALTEAEQMKHWFGWQYDGLDDEIKWIVEHVKLVPPDRIESEAGDIEVVDQGERTLIRAIKPGDAADWEGVYGDIEEGWITFFNQLRHRIARHPSSTRRTIFRPSDRRTMPELPGEPWHESRYQRGADVDGELLVVFARSDGTYTMLVTTYDLDDDEFDAAEDRWERWWAAR